MAVIRFRVATEFNVVDVQVPEEIQQRVDKLIAEGRCTGCEEIIPPGEKVRLHQCPTCYSGTYNAIKKGLVSRKELMEQGKIVPGQKGPRPKNAYTASLRNRA